MKGVGLDNIHISLSHCDNLLICIAGYNEQGCDIENIVRRSEEDWQALLGKDKFLKQKNLQTSSGMDLDFTGTIIWSAFEAFKKALNKTNVEFESFDHFKNTVIFRNGAGNGKLNICSLPIELTRGPSKVFSFSVNIIQKSKDIRRNIKADDELPKKIGYNIDQLFGVEIDTSGPQKQLVLTQRFPVTFKANQTLSRRVYFSNFFEWMGAIREYSIYPVFKEFAKLEIFLR